MQRECEKAEHSQYHFYSPFRIRPFGIVTAVYYYFHLITGENLKK